MQYKIQVNDMKKNDGYLQGLATITFDDAIRVTGVKIGVGKQDSLFIGMPNYKSNEQVDGKDVYKDICYPVTQEFRNELYQRVFDTFDNLHDGYGNTLIYNADSKERVNPEVRVTPIKDSKNGVMGLATIALDNSFVLNNISLRKNKEGELFVAYPSYRTNKIGMNGKPMYQDVFYPVTKEWRQKLDGMIKEAYQQALDKEKEKKAPEQKKDSKEKDNKRSGKARIA